MHELGAVGPYERRYRPTTATAKALAVLGLAIASTLVLPFFPWLVKALLVGYFAAVILKILYSVANGGVAFRADSAGVTLGVILTRFRRTTVFIPWTDIDEIRLWELPLDRRRLPYLTVVRRPGAPDLPAGPLFDRLRTPSGMDPRTNRVMTTWTLDVGRLRTVMAQLAPDVRLVEGRTPRRQRPSPRRRR
ncbi:hypothetical protein ACFYWX_09205 [Streptomyces sp. NPDC002888]|uniref:hypothetical protein n=1 Tax=Streptomyces sp. NPDC002888 TaxID=3364668 RepID=UPI0036CE11C3